MIVFWWWISTRFFSASKWNCFSPNCQPYGFEYFLWYPNHDILLSKKWTIAARSIGCMITDHADTEGEQAENIRLLEAHSNRISHTFKFKWIVNVIMINSVQMHKSITETHAKVHAHALTILYWTRSIS